MPKPSTIELHNTKVDNMFLFASTLKIFNEEVSILINSIKKNRVKIINSDKIITDKDMADLNTINNNIANNMLNLMTEDPDALKKLYKEIQGNLQSLIKKIETIENNIKKIHHPKTEVFYRLLASIRVKPIIKHLVRFLRNQLEPRVTKTEEWRAITNNGNITSHSKDIKSKAQELRNTKLKDFEKIKPEKEELSSTDKDQEPQNDQDKENSLKA